MDYQNHITNHKIIELKGNYFPKGLVPLERLFEKNDGPPKHSLHYAEEDLTVILVLTKNLSMLRFQNCCQMNKESSTLI